MNSDFESLENPTRLSKSFETAGHPDLDPPEFYIRTTGKTKPEAVLYEIVNGLSNDFDSLTL